MYPRLYLAWGVLGMVSCELLVLQDVMSPGLSPAALLAPGWTSPLRDNQSAIAGDINHALNTMNFHRSMMNRYLCHNYLAEEILSSLRSAPDSERSMAAERRSGEAATTDPTSKPPRELLTDQGSSQYQNWLEKSSQLQDLYSGSPKMPEGDHQAYETGHVTGFASMKGDSYPGGSGGGWSSEGGSSWSSEPAGGDWPEESGWDVFGGGWEEQETGKGLALKELFDLALTALAFLAFGLFVLNLIMTCLAKPPHMTLTVPDTTGEERVKRGATNQLNELAYRVLTSIDKWMELQQTSTPSTARSTESCLQYTLCDNNKYSRALNDKNRVWLPVWSLGLSWLAGMTRGVSRLDLIKASVLGLGNAECADIYRQCSATRRGDPS